eukprot:TRINITY_DN896_c0_g2_i1.p1 TRINITY_DN896_c0_g2~~TRINITY_DN896_c0_g2_i1.p1  ORF type:complete len:289 (-),score=40.13 TRINITY_DN896_c0_g2_i1:734-1600(-)
MGTSQSSPSHISPYQYDNKTNAWQLEPFQLLTNSLKKEYFTLVTYNVWFDEQFAFEERCQEIFKILKETDADVICLQEVIPRFATSLLEQDWVRPYSVSDKPPFPTIDSYGVLLLSKPKIHRLTIHPLRSDMGRKCLIAEYNLSEGKKMCVSTVHLESLATEQTRLHQLTTIHQLISGFDISVLMGDFNFDSNRNWSHHVEIKRYVSEQEGEEKKTQFTKEELDRVVTVNKQELENESMRKIYQDFVDIWEVLYPDDPGYTYDSFKNEMVSELNGYEQMRFDNFIHSI